MAPAITTAIPVELRGTGFTVAEPTNRRGMVFAISGLEKSGKTHLALSGDEPILAHGFDTGLRPVVNKFLAQGKKIYAAYYGYKRRVDVKASASEQADYHQTWGEFNRNFEAGLRLGEGTIVIDSWTEVCELARLAKFGKLAQVMPHMYGPVNAELKELIKWAVESNMTVVLLQRLKPLWVNNARTGDYEPAGYSETPFEVDTNMTTWRQPLEGMPNGVEFHCLVKECRDAMEYSGADLRDVLGEDYTLSQFLDLVRV